MFATNTQVSNIIDDWWTCLGVPMQDFCFIKTACSSVAVFQESSESEEEGK